MNKRLLFIPLLFAALSASSQENIYSLLNKEIVLHDSFAGQSFTLVQENNNYYIHRKIFGSGIRYIGTIVYNVVFNSEYKITFSEIFTVSENIRDRYNRNEIFSIEYGNDIKKKIDIKLAIYLNGLKLAIAYIE